MTQDTVCPLNMNYKKRARFRTCSTMEETESKLVPNPPEKELSIKLDDEKAGYAKSFQNYAIKCYDDGNLRTDEVAQDTDLKINLNPCLPVELAFRKTSSNSQNVNQNMPLQSVDSLGLSDKFVPNGDFLLKPNSNMNIGKSTFDTVS